MITIQKIDFQGDELLIHYLKPEDQGRQIRNRMLVVAWKENPEVVVLLNRLFEVVINRYMSVEDGKEAVNWNEFIAELKKYEEKNP